MRIEGVSLLRILHNGLKIASGVNDLLFRKINRVALLKRFTPSPFGLAVDSCGIRISGRYASGREGGGPEGMTPSV